ncbi:MAG: GGDEF domain-containing protein, partial [Coriobacteriales bacterium]|nr:GGDEF domain-containing protein [Coriobacteriales bacterium]
MRNQNTPRISRVSGVSVMIGIALSIVAIALVVAVLFENNVSDKEHKRHFECVAAADQLMDASDELTSEARLFVTTGRRVHADNYIREAFVDKNRDVALDILSANSNDRDAIASLESSLEESHRLSETEYYAMKLVAVSLDMKDMPQAIEEVRLSEEDAKLSNEEKQARAEELVLGDEYQQSKDTIIRGVEGCTMELIKGIAEEEDSTESARRLLLLCLALVVVLFVVLTLAGALMNRTLVVLPIHDYIKSIEQDEPLDSSGSQEMRQMAESYNVMYLENHRKTEELEHEARTDALTGLLNRGSYDRILKMNERDVALILVDIDLFKHINDTCGHSGGDEVLKRVATCIQDQFRTTDYVCRVGGDEFAVVMTKMRNVSRSIVERKLRAITDELRVEDGSLPAVTLSIG